MVPDLNVPIRVYQVTFVFLAEETFALAVVFVPAPLETWKDVRQTVK